MVFPSSVLLLDGSVVRLSAYGTMCCVARSSGVGKISRVEQAYLAIRFVKSFKFMAFTVKLGRVAGPFSPRVSTRFSFFLLMMCGVSYISSFPAFGFRVEFAYLIVVVPTL